MEVWRVTGTVRFGVEDFRGSRGWETFSAEGGELPIEGFGFQEDSREVSPARRVGWNQSFWELSVGNQLLVKGFAAGSVNQGMNSLLWVPAELIFFLSDSFQ